MKTRYYILITGFALLGIGWALRSTFITRDHINKPIGGILITIGSLMLSISIIMMFKKQAAGNKKTGR